MNYNMYILNIPKSILLLILIRFVVSLPMPDGKEGRVVLAPIPIGTNPYQLINGQLLKMNRHGEESDEHANTFIPPLQAPQAQVDAVALSTAPSTPTSTPVALLDPVNIPVYNPPPAAPSPVEISTFQPVSSSTTRHPNPTQPSSSKQIIIQTTSIDTTLDQSQSSISPATSSLSRVAQVTPISDVAPLTQLETTSTSIKITASSTDPASLSTSSSTLPYVPSFASEYPSTSTASSTSLSNLASSSSSPNESSSSEQQQPQKQQQDTFFLLACVFTSVLILVFVAYFSWKWRISSSQQDKNLVVEIETKYQASLDDKSIDFTMNNHNEPQFVDMSFSLDPIHVKQPLHLHTHHHQDPGLPLVGDMNEFQVVNNIHNPGSVSPICIPSALTLQQQYEDILHSPKSLDNSLDLNLHMVKRYAYFGEL